jgi:hypothetical protein
MRGGGIRFAIAALIADYTFYLIYTSVPLKAISLGAGPIVLGLLPALSSTIYIVSALTCGRLAHPGRRMVMARIGVLLLILAALLLRWTSRIPLLFAFLPIVPLGGAFFWPAIQAELGDRGSSSDLGRRIGWFNVSWSSGKMLGFLTAGHLAQALGPGAPLLLAVASGALLFIAAPFDRVVATTPAPGSRGDSGPPGAGSKEGAAADRANDNGTPASDKRRFRIAAWGGNLVVYGVMGTLIYQFPKRVLSLGVREGSLGNFLALVQLTQTLTFVLLGHVTGWERRRATFALPLVLGIASVAPIALWRGEGWILACAPGVGVALGFGYSLSLFHSLHRETESGRFTGIHEAILGSGGFLIPFLSGGIAQAAGLSAPYLFCAGAMAVAAVFSLLCLRGTAGERPSAKPYGSQLPG